MIEKTIELPAILAAQATRYGYEGVTVTGIGADETVWLAVQREWKDDPKGQARLIAYKPATAAWGQVRYRLDETKTGWVGLSEVTSVSGGVVVIERDNLVGKAATVKRLYRVDLTGVMPAALDAKDVPVVEKTLVRDILAGLAAPKGHVLDKVEGFTIDSAGTAYIVTDNDGVDGSSGKTQFLSLGKPTN